jgi:hypothetical protein
MNKARQIGAQQVADSAGQIRELVGSMGDAIQALAKGRPPRVEKLTMADVVGFFVEHRSSAIGAQAAAIVRDQANRGPQPTDAAECLVHLFFLDKEGRPLAGARAPARAYLARRLDDELASAFGSNNVVIFN